LHEINMRFYGAEHNNIERGEAESYWTRRSRVQYSCTLLHKTSLLIKFKCSNCFIT
jgi:hypothetical protein